MSMGLGRTFSEMKGNEVEWDLYVIRNAIRSGRDEYDDLLRTYDYEAGRILKALLGQVSHVRKYKLSENFHDLVIRNLQYPSLFFFFSFLFFFLEIRCTVNLLMFPHLRLVCAQALLIFRFINH